MRVIEYIVLFVMITGGYLIIELKPEPQQTMIKVALAEKMKIRKAKQIEADNAGDVIRD